MAPPIWKLVLFYPEGSQFSSRKLKSEICPCKCCWCKVCGRKWLQESVLSTIRKFLCTDQSSDSLEPPFWKLVLMFEQGSEFTSRQFHSTVGLCRYCWCGKWSLGKFEESDLFTFCKFFSPEAANSLQELLITNDDYDELPESQEDMANLEASSACGTTTAGTSQLLDPTIEVNGDAGQSLESQFQDAMSLLGQTTMLDNENNMISEILTESAEDVPLNQAQEPLLPDLENSHYAQEIQRQQSERKCRNKISMVVEEEESYESDLDEDQESDNSRDPTWSEPVGRRRPRGKATTKVGQKKESKQYSSSIGDNNYVPLVQAELSPNPGTHQRKPATQPSTSKKPAKMLCCPECSKLLKTKRALQLHLEDHKQKEIRRFKCDECPKSFLNLTHLKDHKRVHTGERPYKCDQCSKAFSMPHHLSYHKMSLHTGERPHVCGNCSKAFVSVYKLRIHLRKCNPSGQGT